MTGSQFRQKAVVQPAAQAQPGYRSCRLTPDASRLPSSPGFTYIAMLLAIVIIGITLGAAGKYWSFVMTREKEEELLFRGDQYRRAIEKYYFARPGVQLLPPSIDDLVKDDRFPQAKRHLRQKFKDPMTGEDFVEIKDKLRGNRIIGVKSASNKKPLKQGNFPDLYKDFENKEKYSEWEFKLLIQSGMPGQQPRPGQQVQPQTTTGQPTGIMK